MLISLNEFSITSTTATMPPRKRARRSEAGRAGSHGQGLSASPEPSASHLVSFLTGYAERELSSGSDNSASEVESDPDDEGDDRTPAGKRGLVGTPGRRTPRGTPRKRSTASATPTPRKRKNEIDDQGFLRMTKADRYFISASRGAKTSGSSYTALARPLSQAEYETFVNGVRGRDERVQQTLQHAEKYFDQWTAELEEGFNILVYGYGSKRRLLNRFATTLSKRGHIAVVNGHFPGLGLRDILTSIEDNVGVVDCPTPASATPLERSAHRIYTHFSTGRPLYLILHNIDAPSMRTPKSLAALSLLASCPKIHLIASFDHVHTPLLFSTTQSNTPSNVPDGPITRGFNWLYHHIPTFDDYDLELSYARLSTTLDQSATISEEGALQILRSVPPMAARLLKLLLTRQLENGDATAHPPSTTAPAFALDVDLMQKLARDKFIAREEERFNALLREFRDHGLVVVAEVDGEGKSGRWAWIPLGRGGLERILGEMGDVE